MIINNVIVILVAIFFTNSSVMVVAQLIMIGHLKDLDKSRMIHIFNPNLYKNKSYYMNFQHKFTGYMPLKLI